TGAIPSTGSGGSQRVSRGIYPRAAARRHAVLAIPQHRRRPRLVASWRQLFLPRAALRGERQRAELAVGISISDVAVVDGDGPIRDRTELVADRVSAASDAAARGESALRAVRMTCG